MRYLLIVSGLFFLSPVHAICKWSDAQGQIHYSRHPPPGASCGDVPISQGMPSTNPQADMSSGLRPGEQALLQDIKQRQQEQQAARSKARKQQRKKAAKVAALTAKQQQKCKSYQRRFDRIREQRRKGYKLSQARILDEQMAEAENGMREYCK